MKNILTVATINEYLEDQSFPDLDLSQSANKDKYFTLEEADIISLLNKKPAQKFDHKGKRGTALIVAGSIGKHGAAVLAASAALKTGVGKLYVHVPKSGVDILQISLPEALVDIDQNTDVSTLINEPERFGSIGIGPGIGISGLTRDLLAKLFTSDPKNLVLDADGLNILATDKELWEQIPPDSILTPHFKEFARLCPGEIKNGYDRLTKLSEMAIDRKSIVILKGANTAIASPDGKIYFNTTGNPGMAKAGMGDVLTGMLTTFLARGYDPLEAAMLAVYLHGMAGDLAEAETGSDALSPLDLIARIGLTIKPLRQN